MFCKNCGTDVTNMKYCPNCGNCINDISKKTSTNIPLKEKDYRMYYIVSCCLSTVLFTVYGLLHDFNSVEYYNGMGLEYIQNRSMAQLLGAFIGVAICSGYDVFKRKSKPTLWKVVTAIASSAFSQIVGIVVLFFVIMEFADVTILSDIEKFELLRKRFMIAFVIVVIICVIWSYMVYKQSQIGVRNKEQELRSSILLSSLIAVVETFVIWKVIL